jgi:catecholate siderophore receptor
LLRLGMEHFHDERTVDRGIPSLDGRPAPVPVSTFFGAPDASHSRATVNAAALSVERAAASGLTLVNRTHLTGYDKFYQNVYPGAVSGSGSEVALSAYSAGTKRTNVFNQTDLTHTVSIGTTEHKLLVGTEVGHQSSANLRTTGFFEGGVKTVTVPLASPTVSLPVTFAPVGSEVNSHTEVSVVSAYVQNHATLSRHVQALAGVRYERFALRFRDRRDDNRLSRTDVMISPRAALILKPVEAVSVYGSYGISHLPSSGDQFAGLTPTTQRLAPETFENREVGAKWEVGDLSLTAAFYRMDRTNTTAPDPNDAARIVQTGSQRTDGYEISASGALTSRWDVAWGYASQWATITSRTVAAPEGRTVPLVPRETVSLWNKYQLLPSLAAGVGVVHQGRSFAAIDNSVELPAFTRVDGGVYLVMGARLAVQANAENLLNASYYPTSHGNNNIMPGAPRTLRITATTRVW